MLSDSSDNETPKLAKKIITSTTSAIKDNTPESDVEMQTEYKDVSIKLTIFKNNVFSYKLLGVPASSFVWN